MRYKDWPIKLNAYFTSVKDTPFEYGIHDCCIFAADAVKAITGDDYMEEFRGIYFNKTESREVLKGIGAGTLLRTLKNKFGKPVHGASGQRGDVAWFQGSCGIVIGPDAVFLTKDGYGFAPINKIKWAFRVK